MRMILTFDLPEAICNGPVLQNTAESKLTWSLNLMIHSTVHLLDTFQEDVGSWDTANSKMRGEDRLNLLVEGRVVGLRIHQLLQEILSEHWKGGDSITPLSLDVELAVTKCSVQDQSLQPSELSISCRGDGNSEFLGNDSSPAAAVEIIFVELEVMDQRRQLLDVIIDGKQPGRIVDGIIHKGRLPTSGEW